MSRPFRSSHQLKRPNHQLERPNHELERPNHELERPDMEFDEAHSNPDEVHSELLFAYGTLQTEAVQLSTFGRRLEPTEDALVGYRLKMVRIEDEDFVAVSGTADHRNLEFTGDPADSVEGTVFKVSPSELKQADAYEPAGYKRVLVQSRSGLNAWVYLKS